MGALWTNLGRRNYKLFRTYLANGFITETKLDTIYDQNGTGVEGFQSVWYSILNGLQRQFR